MKKIITLFIVIACVFSFSGCKDPYQCEPDEMPDITLFLSPSPEVTSTPEAIFEIIVTTSPFSTPEVTETPETTLDVTPEATTEATPEVTPTAIPDTPKGTAMYTSPDLTTVYKEADGNSEKLATLERDSEVIAYRVENKMYYVQYETGKFGYIYAFELFSEKNGIMMYATADGVNVRKGPSTSEEKIATLKKGEGYLTFGSVDGWVYVQYDYGKRGYVSEQYISKTPIPNATKYTEMYVMAINTNVRKDRHHPARLLRPFPISEQRFMHMKIQMAGYTFSTLPISLDTFQQIFFRRTRPLYLLR